MRKGLKISSIETAIRIYLENQEIGNAEIRELFGRNLSGSTCASLKKEVKPVMTERNVIRFASDRVNTEIAYEVWGINIADIKRKYKEMEKLGFLKS